MRRTHACIYGCLAGTLLTAGSPAQVSSPPVVQIDTPLQQFRLDLATGEILSEAPAANGPDAPVASFSNTSFAGAFAPLLALEEVVDFGVKNTGLTGIVDTATFGYGTTLLDPAVGGPGASLSFRLYQGTQGSCAASPSEPGTLLRTFSLTGFGLSPPPGPR